MKQNTEKEKKQFWNSNIFFSSGKVNNSKKLAIEMGTSGLNMSVQVGNRKIDIKTMGTLSIFSFILAAKILLHLPASQTEIDKKVEQKTSGIEYCYLMEDGFPTEKENCSVLRERDYNLRQAFLEELYRNTENLDDIENKIKAIEDKKDVGIEFITEQEYQSRIKSSMRYDVIKI